MVRLCRRKFLLAALLALCAAVHSASAAAISFQLVQHDSSQEKVRSASYVMEGVLFDYFFDSGYIATNIPTAASSSEEEDEELFYAALADTRGGLCKYLIMIYVDYSGSASGNPDAVLLSNIRKVSWLVYDAGSERLLERGDRAVGDVPAKSNNVAGVKDLARKIAKDISAAVRKG